ncbi:response regulator [Oscillatoria salina]|uniref:response regulator n=1 Tax=Oscillatoria salina TaxID=331517 RepID=UPI001CCC292D|nr:response regulator [Oscillatoria salina]MBZ8183270.1 response regulator [Oscillatoria salina IIICB1]
MFTKHSIEENYSYFISEAQELLQTIEQDLLTLREERSSAKVHSLMRAAHTLKGAAASVELENISEIAHGLEDIFKSLYNPDVEIDSELEKLLFQAYECLRLAVIEKIEPSQESDPEILNRAASIFADLQTLLGDCFNPEAPIPSSEELGFDMVQSIFEVGVKQRLEELEMTKKEANPKQVAETLSESAEIFIGLAESLNLPGFGAIAKAVIDALQGNPEEVMKIAEVASQDLWTAMEQVMSGDRLSGGQPSAELKQLASRQEEREIITINIEADKEENRENELAENADRVDVYHTEDIFSFQEIDIENEEDEEEDEEEETADLMADSDTNDYSAVSFQEVALEEKEDEETDFIPHPSEVNLENSEELIDHSLDEDVPETDKEEAKSTPGLEEIFGGVVDISDDRSLTIEREDKEIFPEEEEQKNGRKSRENLDLDRERRKAEANVVLDNLNPVTKPLGNKSKTHLGVSTSATVRVAIEQLERLNFQAGELLINQNKQLAQNEQIQAALQEVRDRLKQHQNTLNKLNVWGVGKEEIQTQVLSTRDLRQPKLQLPLDSLELDEYGELQVLLRYANEDMVQLEEATEALELYSRESNQTIEKQQRLLTEVRDELNRARLQPLGEVLNRLSRLLQQLTNLHNKSVELKITGSEVLVDKAIAQKLYDPLLHLVRNAFAHGIEPEAERVAQGKPAVGIIEIRAYNQGNRTIVEVKDDGRGIDFNRVREKAIALGLLTSEAADSQNKAELLDVIFAPGLSTAERVNDLSGRGVGLDVVRSQIQSVKGSISVSSVSELGTTFRMQLPLPLSIAKLLVVEAKQITYAFPSESIEQIILPKSDRLEVLGERRVLQWQQNGEKTTVPLRQLSELVKYNSVVAKWENGNRENVIIGDRQLPLVSQNLPNQMVLLLHSDSGLVGLEVDRVLGEQELVIRQLGNAIIPPNYVYGCTILSDSNLALVIDVVAVVNQELNEDPTTTKYFSAKVKNTTFENFPKANLPLLPPSASRRDREKWVLVVDDSITLRQTLSNSLRRAGYQTIQAKDGVEAIEKLQQLPTVDLIICDLEMPRLNGFEFLNYSRETPSISKIPILVLTSRQGEKHRQIALGLGAAGYLTKPYLEKELLDAIAKELQTTQLTA